MHLGKVTMALPFIRCVRAPLFAGWKRSKDQVIQKIHRTNTMKHLVAYLFTVTLLAASIAEAQTFNGIGAFPWPTPESWAWGVSDNGLTVSGYSYSYNTGSGSQSHMMAASWTQATGLSELGILGGFNLAESYAARVSGNGNVTVGGTTTNANMSVSSPFKHTPQGGMVQLPPIIPGNESGFASAASRNRVKALSGRAGASGIIALRIEFRSIVGSYVNKPSALTYRSRTSTMPIRPPLIRCRHLSSASASASSLQPLAAQ